MQEKNINDKINKIIETSLKNITNLIDVNTVVGQPILGKSGEYIVPVSKVTVGVLVGGGEYGKVGIFKKGEDLPYSAGNGAVISIKPCGFLVGEQGKYKVLSVSDTPIEKLVDKTTDILSEIQRNN